MSEQLTPQQQLDIAQARHDWAMMLNSWGEHPAVRAVGAFSGGALNAVLDPLKYTAHLANSMGKWGQLQTPEQAAVHAQQIEQQAARPGIFPDWFNERRQTAMQQYPELATLGEMGMGIGTYTKVLPAIEAVGGKKMAGSRALKAAAGIEGTKENMVEPALDKLLNQGR